MIKSEMFAILAIINFFSIFLLCKISKKFNLIDRPNKRKRHKVNAHIIGGIVLMISTIFIIFLNNFDKDILDILICSILMGIVGIIDDKYKINHKIKLILQSLPIVLILSKKILLVSLGEYNILGNLTLGHLSLIFTVLSTYLLINATNYFDGKDGNLLIMFIIIHLILKFLINESQFYELNKLFNYMILTSFLLLIVNLGNFSGYKVFLGDCGSLMIGFYLSFLFIYLANQNIVHPILIAATISIIVYDFIYLTIFRFIKNNKTMFRPDNNHIHHQLNEKLKSNYLSLLMINIINLFIFASIYLLFVHFNSFLSLILFVLYFLIFCFFRMRDTS
jgi:UDP-GlcNAc:undecaprenyl-phosphate GlcNAc-1-phosphate transferase